MTTGQIPRLPAVVKRYFEASNRRDAAATAACFATDGVLEDQFGQHVGRAEIEKRIIEINRRFRPAFALLRDQAAEEDVGLVVSVSGDFPGSPVQLDFHFRIRCRKIAALTIER